MYRAVLWDFGGVITTSPFEAFNRYEQENGLPVDFIRTINSRNPNDNAWAQFERNDVSAEEFSDLFEQESGAAGHAIPGRDVLALLSGRVRPAMALALPRIKQHFTLACLTNNFAVGDSPAMTFDAERTREVQAVMALFHIVIESSKVGMRKPDPRIYAYVCQQIDVAAEDIVYLDDLGINLKPARALGMTTIKVTDPDAALAELSGLLDLPLN